jgi:RNA polymerase sigma-70 factor (ECF subfamily)
LVELARGGDDDAYATLVRAHQDVAFRIAMLITADAAEAQEAAQDAFIKAHRALHRFRAGEPLRPWLLAIVANEARNRRRSGGRRERLGVRAAAERRLFEDAAPSSPEAALLSAERRSLLLGKIAQLREGDRLVIGCRFLLELSEAETARALGCRPGTVKSRLSRALARLREMLPAEELR